MCRGKQWQHETQNVIERNDNDRNQNVKRSAKRDMCLRYKNITVAKRN